jgi:hypothetical protein
MDSTGAQENLFLKENTNMTIQSGIYNFLIKLYPGL